MIRSFGCSATERLFHGRGAPKKWGSVTNAARRKLDMLNAAANLNDLRAPPANRLEKLSGKLAGWHSIRINDQFRIIFKWEPDGAYEVQIVDYH
jgi:proteic killer suppression protein